MNTLTKALIGLGLLYVAGGQPARADLPVQARSLSSVWTEPSQLQDGVELWYQIPGGALVHGVTEGGRVTLRPETSSVPEDPEPESRHTSWGQVKNMYKDAGLEAQVQSAIVPKVMSVTEFPSFPVEEGFLYIDGSNAVNQHGATHWSAIKELDYNRFMSGDTLKVVLPPNQIQLPIDGAIDLTPEMYWDLWDIGNGWDYDHFVGFHPSAFPMITYLTNLGYWEKIAVRDEIEDIMDHTGIPIWGPIVETGGPTAPPFYNFVPGAWGTGTGFDGTFVTYAVCAIGGTFAASIAHEAGMRGQTHNGGCYQETWSPSAYNLTAGPRCSADDAALNMTLILQRENVAGLNDIQDQDYRGTLN